MQSFKKISSEEKLNFFKSLNKDFNYRENPSPILEIENLKITEYPESTLIWEGFTGELKKNANLISRIYLWDCRWKVEIENPSKRNSPEKVKVLALKKSREEAIQLIQSGRKIKSSTTPKTLGGYHSANMKWLKRKITQLQAKKLYFHLPVHEYHFYINEIETAAGKRFDEMHAQLNTFASLISEDLKNFCERENVQLEFIEPLMDNSLEDVIESYKWPYMNLPLVYPDEEFIGIETLYETKLIANTRIQNGVFGIFAFKDFYLEKFTDEQNSITLCVN